SDRRPPLALRAWRGRARPAAATPPGWQRSVASRRASASSAELDSQEEPPARLGECLPARGARLAGREIAIPAAVHARVEHGARVDDVAQEPVRVEVLGVAVVLRIDAERKPLRE